MNASHEALLRTVKTHLKREKSNQAALATAMEVSQSYISDLMHGRRGVTPNIASRICDAFGLKPKQRAEIHRLGARADGWDV